MYELRLFISKRGRIKYVSHLDMLRLMQRAVRRAGIPIWYTEGFNPHPYICFLNALPLGIESAGEPADIKIVGDMTPEEVRNALNKNLPEGLFAEQAAEPYNKSSELFFAEYNIEYDEDDISEKELYNSMMSGNLVCEKRGKSGGKKVVRSIDISDRIDSFGISHKNGGLCLGTVLCAGSENSLNPVQLNAALSFKLGRELNFVSAERTAFLCEDKSRFC